MTKNGIVGERVHDFFRRDKCTDWHASAHSFCAKQYVRNNVVMFECPEFTCSAISSLYLVKDKKCPLLIARFSQLLKICYGCSSDATFTLHRFDDYSCCIFRNLCQVFNVSKVEYPVSWNQRTKVVLKILISTNR